METQKIPLKSSFPVPENTLKDFADKAFKEVETSKVPDGDAPQFVSNEILKQANGVLTDDYKLLVQASIVAVGGKGESELFIKTSISALWNAEKDGAWSYSYKLNHHKTIVVNVTWIYIGIDK